MRKLFKDSKILRAIYKVIKVSRNKDELNHIIYGQQSIVSRNINLDVLRHQKRVLICYLDACTIANLLDNSMHTNVEEIYTIIKYFIESDYVIDLADNRNDALLFELKNNNYDVIFGFGKAYQLAVKKWKDALHIEYFTESPFSFSEKKENERVLYFNTRHKKNKKLYRTGMFYQKDDEKNADAIIHMCNSEYFDGIKAKLYRIYPHGLYNSYYEQASILKNPTKFLVFGANGYIHKGIDLVIETFALNPRLCVYICGGLEEFYRDNGTKLPKNVIDCGRIRVDSAEYLKLVNECMFVLLPSCSEASPSGVITCMRHGLIPVITAGLGLDSFSECFFFEKETLDGLREMIEYVSNYDMADLKRRSDTIYSVANSCFTLDTYNKNLVSIMDSILCEG